MLDAFFGYGADAVEQPGVAPGRDEMAAGYALGRFEGLNNEPDMDAPWAYLYAGRADRTAEVVHAIVTQMFGTGRGGLPGNDDSGGLSSWFVWACLGLFPVPGQSLFLLHPPAIDGAQLRMARGELAIMTSGAPEGVQRYIASVTHNGVPIAGPWIPARALHEGGELAFTLADAPTRWGVDHRPPSFPTIPKGGVS
jgi:putative alpha-1,2-mannosidase